MSLYDFNILLLLAYMDLLLLFQERLRDQVRNIDSEQKQLKSKKQEMESQLYQEKGSLKKCLDK
jgi:Sec-independent protein translocase protein TatA